MTDQEAHMTVKLLGLSLGELFALKTTWEANGYKIRKFILPHPKINIYDLPVMFADVEKPTVELK